MSTLAVTVWGDAPQRTLAEAVAVPQAVFWALVAMAHKRVIHPVPVAAVAVVLEVWATHLPQPIQVLAVLVV